MEANQFVRKFGWDKSIEIADGYKNAFHSSFHYWSTVHNDYYLVERAYTVDVHDLKRLVESHELVEKNQGLNGAKNTLKLLQSSLDIGLYHGISGIDAETEIPKLKKAIADVESCQ